jgi:two-component system sensor histidine kinase GlrK
MTIPLEETLMRLTIFWRIVLAQVALIALIVVVNVYALSQLNDLTRLTADILVTDATSVEEGKRLLRVFLGQMRHAEKYVLLQDKTFYQHFADGSKEFTTALDTLATLVDTPYERNLLSHISTLFEQYQEALATALTPKSAWQSIKGDISEGIISTINELIHTREGKIAHKTAAARDQAAFAAAVVKWLTGGGIAMVVLLSFINARRVSRPLKSLAQELRLVGKGEFQRHLEIQSPAEVAELAREFNWMAGRLAKLDEMKEEFIAHISHELRTPLTAIREGTTLLREEIPGPLSASQRQIVDVLRNHSERLFHFLSSVLDLSKMQAGMMEYVRDPSDLPPLLERSTQMVEFMAQRKGIRLEVVCPQSLPLLSLDEARMQQVFDNLLTNAVKFTPNGGVIQVSAVLNEDRVKHERWIEVRVSDTGVGILDEEIERIFDKFYQSPLHQQAPDRGTGLGLAIAQHVVVAHGGRIWVESKKGSGSTFVILLPVTEGRWISGEVTLAPVGSPLNFPHEQEGARDANP